jgi:molecular chaperone HscB
MTTNPFALLGLSPAFEIDAAILLRNYLAAQQATHPDRLPATASALERQAAMLKSMEVNDAYQALKSPLSRAQALLAIHGIRVGGEGDTHKPSTPLLMEVMEWREALEEATDADALATQVAQLQQEATRTESQLAQECAASDWAQAAQSTLRLQYLDKTLQDAKAKRRQLAARVGG